MPRATLDIDASVLRELKRRQQHQKKEPRPAGLRVAGQSAGRRRGGPQAGTLAWTSKPLGVKVHLEDKETVWAVLDGR